MSAIAIGAAMAFIGFGAKLTATPPADVLTYHNDNARTGQNQNETILTPANVNVATFGKVGFFSVDGKVDAQPLLLSGVAIPGQGTHDVLYVATEHDSVYALDAKTGAQLWKVSLLGAGESPSDTLGCSQVTPEIGITSTPVIDKSGGPNGVIYAVAMSKTGSTYIQRLHALDVTTGAELFAGPKLVQFNGGGTMTFNPKQYEERAALLLLNGKVITSWTSHCDIDPYNGWIMSYDASTLAQTSVLNTTPNGSRGAFWMAGAGPAADSLGNVYLLAGNGTFDTTLNGGGFPTNGDYGNAFIKVSTATGLAVADYFTMFDTVSQSNADTDLGSGGTLLLPDLPDMFGVLRHLAVGTGKDTHIYVVDRDAMGHFNPSNNNNVYQDLPGALPGGVWAMPAYFNNTVYYGSVGSTLKAFSIVQAKLVSPAGSHSMATFPYPGTTPGVSASGTANGIVWAVANSNPAVLRAFDALDLSHELYNSSQAAASRDAFGAGNKFITPTIVNGRVYVGTPNGVAAFGLLGTPPTTVTGAASAITRTTATLGGTANPNGTATTASFEYGTTTGYGSATPGQALGAGTSAVPIGGGGLAGLTCGTLYHFRAVATNSIGTTNGLDATFTTTACQAPTVVTGLAIGIAKTGATLNGTANPNGLTTTANFEYGLTTGYGGTTPVQSMGSGSGALAIGGGAVSGLACNTLYHFRAVATSAGGPGVGADATFMTSRCTLPGDFDGDGKSDITVFRPSTGGWYTLKSSGNYTSSLAFIWGASTDTVVPGDYDGDGKVDPAVFRPSTAGWYFLMSSTNYTTSGAVTWGVSTDVPVPGDYDGDGKTDPAVFRPSTAGWYFLKSNGNYTTSGAVTWGASTDTPVCGDYDGDGKADPAVFRPSTAGWYFLKSSTNFTTSGAAVWGASTDIAVPGDYDGDGRTDPTVFRPSTGGWYFLNSSTNFTSSGAAIWGSSTDVPVPTDYDGDGKTDPAVFRPSTGGWYSLKSSTNYTSSFGVVWGIGTDTPINRRP